MYKFLKKITFFAIFCVFFLGAKIALALEIKNYPILFGGQTIDDSSKLSDYTCYLASLVLQFALFISVIVIAAGGVFYLLDYGRGKFANRGKEWIKSGISGLLLIVFSVLIASTINPNLVKCSSGILSPITLIITGRFSGTTTNIPVETYKEIPIGKLTENLLTRTMDCYGFDKFGNPIEAGGTGNDAEPTYLNYDRTDCLTQLMDGAQKKSQVIAATTDEIMKIMDKCSCEGKCTPSCTPGIGGCKVTRCPNGTCSGACVGAACLQPQDTQDCCPVIPGTKISSKTLAENGPLTFTIDLAEMPAAPTTTTGEATDPATSTSNTCKSESITTRGMDEFRCPNPNDSKTHVQTPCSNIAGWVEKPVQKNGATKMIIDKDKWDKLNLLQQLTYFKEKISILKLAIEKDKNELEKAETMLSQCYLAMSYSDLLKKYSSTSQNKKLILTQKIFNDPPDTGNKIDPSKYCLGFNYDNSSCLKKCSDWCPDTGEKLIQCYKEIKPCDPSNISCLNNKKKEVEECYNQRLCTSGPNTSQTFSSCVQSCQGDCLSNCPKLYSSCSNEFKNCQDECNNNSKCVIDNSDSCLIDTQKFQNCAARTADSGNIRYCFDDAYLCKNGSDQFAGYTDCVNTKNTSCSTTQYSASSLFESFYKNNLNCEKCQIPYTPAQAGSYCSSITNPTAGCATVCPETTKCPPASECANCPCDKIEKTLNFFVPNQSYTVTVGGNRPNIGQEGYFTSEQAISAYQLVGPTCNDYSYNDDPLTFYCQNDWWTDATREGQNKQPLGIETVCSKGGEVPVGQSVDDAEKWAKEQIIAIEKMSVSIQNIINQMIKVGIAKNPNSTIRDYCKCNAKMETGLPICKTGCAYYQMRVNEYNEFGDYIGWHWSCGCRFEPCDGKPCQQITDYLSQLWNNFRQFKLDFIDFYINTLKEPRSDIFKELIYSRKKVNSCSSSLETKLLNCTRIKDEVIPPVNQGNVIFSTTTASTGCYGQALGLAANEILADNWFCCENYKK